VTPARQRARRRFGQHYLAPVWADRVVAAIDPKPGDVFLEIGPGQGALTLPLAAAGVPVLAVEIDRDLVRALAPRLPPNVTLLSGDILDVDVVSFLRGLEPRRPPESTGAAPAAVRYRVAGNLPYNIATPILYRLLEIDRRHRLFADATVMVQKEVADRLAARPGTKAYGTLTVIPSLRADVTRLLDLPPGAFLPRPAVRSTVVRLSFRPPAVPIGDEAALERLVKALFMYRRKTLANALKRASPAGLEALAASGLDGRRRPETLDLAEIARLADLVAAAEEGRPGRPPVV
jgi:16S rRNA (adenine1518-N6/adenine1519-N6)-dimethyltransferase